MIESEYLKKIINKKLQHLILRGARTTVISDTQILIEDIEEWLSKDARIIQNASNIHIAFDVYSKADYQGGGLIVSLNFVKKSYYVVLFSYFLFVLFCCIFIVWLITINLAYKIDVWKPEIW